MSMKVCADEEISSPPLTQQNDNLNSQFHTSEDLTKAFEHIFEKFNRMIKKHAYFHAFFSVLCTLEVLFLFIFSSFMAQSLILALSLALIFFSFFAYFTLRIYLQTKKPEQLREIVDRYIQSYRAINHYDESCPENYLNLANECCKLANRLHAKEYTYYAPPTYLSFLAPWMERISCWLHWQDLHLFRELLLQYSVEEHIKVVKCQPISLEAHAALANAYVMLSGLYIDPRKMEGYSDDRWIPANKYDETYAHKFRVIAQRAIEEFKILSEYAPDDPWVHCQLAYSYHDLQMPLEEIREYETIQMLIPDDKDNLFKLGTLYFQQGLNAKGLKVYEELKKAHYKKAESVLKDYGSSPVYKG